MRKIRFSLLTVATLLILMTGVGGWIASTTQARVEAPAPQGIDLSQITMNARDLPATEFTDYTFVFSR